MKTRNKKLETRNEKLETTNENKQFEKNEIIKEEPKEIKSSNWFDKNKFKEILVIIDNNKFNYKYRTGKFKYTDIENLVNNIKNNTISEIDAKKYLNKLNEIKNVEIIKYKKRTPGHKKLLNLFNKLLNIILTEKTSESHENEKVESKKEENKNENENKKKKTIINTKKDENEDEDENKNMLLEHIEDIDDKVFKKYSHGKDFDSFINEFHSATNKDKEKIVKELKEIVDIVHHHANMEDDFSEYKKNPSKEQVNEHKMTKKQIYRKFTNLSQEKLNAINNKETYVKNDVMTTIIKRCIGEKKKRHKSNWWI